MIELLWPDGTVSSGKTYREVEEYMRHSQWRGFKTRWEFRHEMQKRAMAWSGRKVSVTGSPERFIRRLASVGMFLLVDCVQPPTGLVE